MTWSLSSVQAPRKTLPSNAITSRPSVSRWARSHSHDPINKSRCAAPIFCSIRRTVASLGQPYRRVNQLHVAPSRASSDCGRSATCDPIWR